MAPNCACAVISLTQSPIPSLMSIGWGVFVPWRSEHLAFPLTKPVALTNCVITTVVHCDENKITILCCGVVSESPCINGVTIGLLQTYQEMSARYVRCKSLNHGSSVWPQTLKLQYNTSLRKPTQKTEIEYGECTWQTQNTHDTTQC